MDDFVNNLFCVIKDDLNKEEQKKLEKVCDIKDSLKDKIKILNLRIDSNNKEFKRKQIVIEKLEKEINDLEEEHKKRIFKMSKEHKETVDKLQKELSEARKKQFIIKT